MAPAFENTKQVAVRDEVIIPEPKLDSVHFTVESFEGLTGNANKDGASKLLNSTEHAKNLVDDSFAYIYHKNMTIFARDA